MYTELLFHDICACIELGGEHLIQVQYCQHTIYCFNLEQKQTI